jgi:iron-sulfur cluster repair protein YtfE (RIC family)
VPPTTLNPQTTPAEIVNLHPPLARELVGRDLEYCCGGAATLSDACAANGLDVATVIDKVVSVHGARHLELAQINTCFNAIRADLQPHLTKEERVLFPMIRELDSLAAAEAATVAPSFHCGSIQTRSRSW